MTGLNEMGMSNAEIATESKNILFLSLTACIELSNSLCLELSQQTGRHTLPYPEPTKQTKLRRMGPDKQHNIVKVLKLQTDYYLDGVEAPYYQPFPSFENNC